MGVQASMSFRTDNITDTLDRLEVASPSRKWKCKRDGDVAQLNAGSQTKMRLLGGITIADKDYPKSAIITGWVDDEGESGVITIEAKPAAGVDNAGGRLAVTGRWETALDTWVKEIAQAMGAP
jgi:hypothetical protein